MINFTKYRKIYLFFSGALVIASILAIIFFGLNLGIELAGGTILEVSYSQTKRPPIEEVREKLSQIGDFQIQAIEDDSFLIRTTKTDEELYGKMMTVLAGAEQQYFESIGPTVGEELKTSTTIAMILASVLIIIYIAFSFAGTSGPIASWQYGVTAAVVAFLHDVLIVIGIFSVLGYFLNVQFTIPIVVALLTTLGYSLNDTIVIFDRIRENIGKIKGGFEEIVNKSLNETITRSINTSLTTLLVLLAILFFGGETLFYFILALVIGIILGTYSSIFLAGSLILLWRKRFDKIK